MDCLFCCLFFFLPVVSLWAAFSAFTGRFPQQGSACHVEHLHFIAINLSASLVTLL